MSSYSTLKRCVWGGNECIIIIYIHLIHIFSLPCARRPVPTSKLLNLLLFAGGCNIYHSIYYLLVCPLYKSVNTRRMGFCISLYSKYLPQCSEQVLSKHCCMNG